MARNGRTSTSRSPPTTARGEATRFYVNGAEPVVTVETSRGYRIQGTTTHRITVVDANGDWQWRRFADLARRRSRADDARRDDRRASRRPASGPPGGVLDVGPSDLRAALPVNAGPRRARRLLHGRRLAPRPRPSLLRDRRDDRRRRADRPSSAAGCSASRPPSTPKHGLHRRSCWHSVRLGLWWEACGFAKHAPTATHRGKGYEAHIPDAILYTNDPAVYRAFVRGLFEADGNVNNGYASFVDRLRTVQPRRPDAPAGPRLRDHPQGRRAGLGHKGANPHPCPPPAQRERGRPVPRRDLVHLRAQARRPLPLADHPQAARYDLVPVSRDTIDRLAPDNDHLRKTMLLSLARTGMVVPAGRDRAARADVGPGARPVTRLLLRRDRQRQARRRAADLRHLRPVQRDLRGERLREPQHHRVHDGLRHDRDRARHRADQVQEARRRGLPQDRQPDRPGGAAQARLRRRPGRGDPRLHRRARDDRGRPAPQAGAPAGLRLRLQAGQRRPLHPLHGPRPDDGRGPAVPLAARSARPSTCPRPPPPRRSSSVYLEGWKLGLKAIAIYRDNSKRSQPLSRPARRRATTGADAVDRRGREAARSSSPRPRPRPRSPIDAGCRPSARRSPTSSTSPGTRATSPSASTRTASPARSSSRWPRRARPCRA